MRQPPKLPPIDPRVLERALAVDEALIRLLGCVVVAAGTTESLDVDAVRGLRALLRGAFPQIEGES